MSETGTSPIGELAKAYVAAYADIDNAVKNAHNPHFKSNYVDLAGVLDTVKPVFMKHGLALLQGVGKLAEVAGQLAISIVGVLMHSSGQTISMEMQIPVGAKATAQSAGSAITYGRRYQLAAVAGIAQVDDDGNAASGRSDKREKAAPEPVDDAPETELTADDIRTAIDAAVAAKSREALKELEPAISALGDDALVEELVAARKMIGKGKGK